MNNPQIAIIGSLNIDIVVETDRFPQIGETILGNKVHYIPGGKGANQAVATARLGADTMMIGAIGDDRHGQLMKACLEKEAINIEALQVIEDEVTGIASIISADQNNQIVVIPGANACLVPEDIERAAHLLEKVDIVLVQLEIPLTTAFYAIELLKKLGKKIILNPAPADDLPAEMYKQLDYITPNESELAYLSGETVVEGVVPYEAMQKLIDRGVKHVITTLGKAGAAYLDHTGKKFQVFGHLVEVKDTTGAGDAFNAGLAFSIAKGLEINQAIEFANKVAALSTMKQGAQPSMPTYDEVLNFQFAI